MSLRPKAAAKFLDLSRSDTDQDPLQTVLDFKGPRYEIESDLVKISSNCATLKIVISERY